MLLQAMYYTFVSLNYGFTALKWGWLPFIVVLGATSAYCGPSFNIKRDIRQSTAESSPLSLHVADPHSGAC